MFKRVFILGLAALALASCRGMILEERTECPTYLFFHIENGDRFDDNAKVDVTAFDAFTSKKMSADTTSIGPIQRRVFALPVKKSHSVYGYGITGHDNACLRGDSEWVVAEGEDGAPLCHFSYRTVVDDGESTDVPVEMLKDYSNIEVRFLEYDAFTSAGGIFPFYLRFRGNTTGLNALTGIPTKGVFDFTPEEETAGLFRFTAPRQVDHALVMELWAKPGLYDDEGLICTFNLWDVLREREDFSWDMPSLPDFKIELSYREAAFRIQVMGWDDQYSSTIEA